MCKVIIYFILWLHHGGRLQIIVVNVENNRKSTKGNKFQRAFNESLEKAQYFVVHIFFAIETFLLLENLIKSENNYKNIKIVENFPKGF